MACRNTCWQSQRAPTPAACWLGDKWTITTKKLGEDTEHSVTIGQPRIAATDRPGRANVAVTVRRLRESRRVSRRDPGTEPQQLAVQRKSLS